MRKLTRFALGGAAAFLLAGTTGLYAVDSVSVDYNATIGGNGTVATVTGSILCSTTETFSVTAIITQSKGQTQVAGQGTSSDTQCTGAVQPFAVAVSIVIPAGETFKKGPASLIATASSDDGVTFDSVTLVNKIHISQ